MTRVLVIYDISDDRIRSRVAKILENWGLSRIQKSAFAGKLQRARIKDLARKLERIIDKDTDIIHIVPLQPREWYNAVVLGKPQWVRTVITGVSII